MSVPEWIDFKGKKILYVDYRKHTEDEMIDLLEKEANMMKENGKTKLIVNFDGAAVPPNFLKRAKELGKETINPNTDKSAIVGVDGIKAILLKAYNTFSGDKLHPVKTLDEAKEYVIS
jgi:hypothetical protein